MEEEFGICELPQAVTRFGFPYRLRILPPKRQKTPTQLPEPHRDSSFLKGSWETVWGCDVDDMDFVEPPLDSEGDVDSSSDSVPYQDSGHDQVVATPRNGAPWSTDGEITPMFSSNFPSTPDANSWKHGCHPNAEFPPTSNSRPEPDAH